MDEGYSRGIPAGVRDSFDLCRPQSALRPGRDPKEIEAEWKRFARLLSEPLGDLAYNDVKDVPYSPSALTFASLPIKTSTGARGSGFSQEEPPGLCQTSGQYLKSGAPEFFETSAEEPRAIIHKDRLFVAVTNSGNLQAAEYDPVKDEYTAYSVDYSTTPPTVLTNPASCFQCHPKPWRPRWMTYNIWAGSYGGTEDSLRSVRMPEGGYHQLENTPEQKKWRKFYEKKGEGIYGYLDIQDEYGTEYADHDILAPIRGFPNLSLGLHFNLINLHQIYGRIKKQTPYDAYLYAYAAAFSNCPDIPSFLPERLRRARCRGALVFPGRHHWIWAGKPVKDLFGELKDSTGKVTEREFARKVKLYRKLNDLKEKEPSFANTDQTQIDTVTALRYLIEGQGLSMRDWSLSHSNRGYSYNFEDALGGIRRLYLVVVPDVLEREASRPEATRIPKDRFPQFYNEFPGTGGSPSWKGEAPLCDALKKRSLEALGRLLEEREELAKRATVHGAGPAPAGGTTHR